MPAPTGAHSELWYRWELTGGSNPLDGSPDFAAGDDTEDDTPKPFGGNATATSFEITNNPLDVFEPSSREMAQIVAQHFEGSITIDWELTNPWWLQGVVSAVSDVTANGDAFIHTMDGDVPLPMTVNIGYEGVATDTGDPLYRVLRGVVNQNATATVTTEGSVDISYTAIFADEVTIEPGELEGQPSIETSGFDVMTFAEAMLELDGSTLSLVQEFSTEINNNTDIIREVGTRIGVDYSPKGRIPSVDFTQIRESHDHVEATYGEQAATTVQERVESDGDINARFDDGENEIALLMGGDFPESLSTENLGNPQEDLNEAVNRRLRTVMAEATVSEETPV